MDFANISLKEAHEKPVPVHLALDNSPLYVQADKQVSTTKTDKPCRVLLIGPGSEKVSAIIREIERLEMVYGQRTARAKDSSLNALAEQHQNAMRDATGRLVQAAVVGFEGIVFDGKEVEVGPEYIDRLCGPRTAFFSQVYDAILEQKRLFPSAASA